jgi:hypothetical protein
VFTVKCIAGPLARQIFQVTDIGRAMISGNCADIDKVKAPVLSCLAARAGTTVGPIEAQHADKAHPRLFLRQDLQVIEQVTRGRMPSPLAPCIEGLNLRMPFEPVVAHGKNAIRKIIFVGTAGALEVDLEPVVRQ